MAGITQPSPPNGHAPDLQMEPGSLKETLNAALAKGFECKARYVHTTPKACDALFSPLPGQEPEKTHLASHFLTVSVHPSHTAGSSIAIADYLINHRHGLLGIGIEILVYTTKYLTTVFVSKADTTGYVPNLPPSRTRAVCSAFLKWLVTKQRRKHPSRKLVVSLFARAQDQYLFPGSVDNSSKHVLTDRQLIKWWTKVLDLTFLAGSSDGNISQRQGYLTVPGFAGPELRQFYPPGNTTADGTQRWLPGHPLRELAEIRGISPAAPPRCLLPRFPDDPKARYIIDLDEEVGLTFMDDAPTESPVKRRNGQWSTIKDLERFWEAMEFRQECSSGRMVGFLWVVISPAVQLADDAAISESQESLTAAWSGDSASQHRDETPTPALLRSSRTRKRKALTGPVVPRKPRLKGGSSILTGSSSTLNGMIDPTAPRDAVTLSRDGYDRAMSLLLKGSDFTKLDSAARSTSRWVTDVASIAGIQGDWAVDVKGEAELELTSAGLSYAGQADGQVNDLGANMVRKKKRKAGDDVASASISMEPKIVADAPVAPKHQMEANTIAANVLGAGMVRKKPKIALS